MKLKPLFQSKMKKSILVSFLLVSIVTFSQKFTKEEREFILAADSTQMFKVIQITEPNELKILKAVSRMVVGRQTFARKDKNLPCKCPDSILGCKIIACVSRSNSCNKADGSPEKTREYSSMAESMNSII